MPPNAQYLMGDSVGHSSNNGDYEGQQNNPILQRKLQKSSF